MTVAVAPPPAFVEAMLDPGFYPHHPRAVELRETHISWVFRVGGLAYKVKKPITLPFLDYGTLQERRRMCFEEVRLNRRLAPRIYLRVVGIIPRGDGYALGLAHDSAAIECAVEMRAVEEDRSLEALAARGALDASQIAAVATRIACFHACAPIVPPERRALDRLAVSLQDNLATLRSVAGRVIDENRLRAAEAFTAAFLASGREQLAARAEAGRIRECHGDLRAEHVILPAVAPLYVFDCVEFDRGLREIDVAADLAFLVMDMARCGVEALVRGLIDSYRSAGGDAGEDRLLFFFASYRAWVRAVVACERALELPADTPERTLMEAEARDLVDLGHRFAWRTRGLLLLVVCGVSASGKTTLAERLARVSGWPHISSDLTRKRIAGIPADERGGEGLYVDELTAGTYREMGRAARAELRQGACAIVDATFNRQADRKCFEEGLGEEPHPRLVVECVSSPEVLLRRARERQRDPSRVSDAGPDVVVRQLADHDPFERFAGATHLQLRTDADPDRLVVDVEGLIDRPR